MKRLSKEQAKRKEEITLALQEARDKVTEEVEAYNEARVAEWEKIKATIDEFNQKSIIDQQPIADALTQYNTAVEQANEFAEEVHSELESYYDERSEKWQDGDAGNAFADWMSEWEVELEQIELEEPAAVDPEEPISIDFDLDIDPFESLNEEIQS